MEIEEGTVVAFFEEEGELVLRPVETSIEAAFGLVKAKRSASLSDMKQAIRAKGSS